MLLDIKIHPSVWDSGEKKPEYPHVASPVSDADAREIARVTAGQIRLAGQATGLKMDLQVRSAGKMKLELADERGRVLAPAKLRELVSDAAVNLATNPGKGKAAYKEWLDERVKDFQDEITRGAFTALGVQVLLLQSARLRVLSRCELAQCPIDVFIVNSLPSGCDPKAADAGGPRLGCGALTLVQDGKVVFGRGVVIQPTDDRRQAVADSLGYPRNYAQWVTVNAWNLGHELMHNAGLMDSGAENFFMAGMRASYPDATKAAPGELAPFRESLALLPEEAAVLQAFPGSDAPAFQELLSQARRAQLTNNCALLRACHQAGLNWKGRAEKAGTWKAGLCGGADGSGCRN